MARPRTPENWRQTVQRMADRSTLLAPIGEQEQWQVTAYLIAISPELQRSARQQRAQQQVETESQQAAIHLTESGEAAAPAAEEAYDPEQAGKLFESQCSLCHPLAVVEAAPPGSETEARELVARMVSNGLSATEAELLLIVRHLSETYGR